MNFTWILCNRNSTMVAKGFFSPILFSIMTAMASVCFHFHCHLQITPCLTCEWLDVFPYHNQCTSSDILFSALRHTSNFTCRGYIKTAKSNLLLVCLLNHHYPLVTVLALLCAGMWVWPHTAVSSTNSHHLCSDLKYIYLNQFKSRCTKYPFTSTVDTSGLHGCTWGPSVSMADLLTLPISVSGWNKGVGHVHTNISGR